MNYLSLREELTAILSLPFKKKWGKVKLKELPIHSEFKRNKKLRKSHQFLQNYFA